MNTSRDTESENGNEVLSQSKPNCIGLRECRKTNQSNTTQHQKEQIGFPDMESNNDVEMFSQSQNSSSQGVSSLFSELIVTQKSSNHSTLFTDIMKKTVLHHKIPYWNEIETKGDGNCFYNAILDQIENNPGIYDTL